MIYDDLLNLTGSPIITMVIQCLVPLTLILVFALYAIYAERKVSAFMQDRLGPNRTGYRGWLQTTTDLIKLLEKEDIVSPEADKPLFVFAPILVFAASFLAFSAIPFSARFIGTNLDLGVLVILGASSIVVLAILMAGWSSNNKYSLIGAMRSVSQIVSYEIPTFIVVLTMIMITNKLNLLEISKAQTGFFWNWWILGGPEMGLQKFLYLPLMIIAFIVIFISTLAEVNRTPFDLPEAESELVAGYHTEYAGIKWAMFMLAEYANMFAVSCLVAAFFFGGYNSPIGYLGDVLHLPWLVTIEQFFWFTAKGLFFTFVHMWLRWTLPRLRVDQLMTACWKYLIPISFVNLLIVGLITLIK